MAEHISGGSRVGTELAADGTLKSWNDDFGQLFPQAQEGIHASELLPEADRVPDRERLGSLQSSHSSMVRVPAPEAPRWYQITDWKVPGQVGIFRALVDVSSREVGLWFEYLEELYHRLASDLHDGPAQVAAALRLTSCDAAGATVAFEGLRDRLDFLRSPLLDATPSAPRWCHDLCDRYLPNCTLKLILGDLNPSAGADSVSHSGRPDGGTKGDSSGRTDLPGQRRPGADALVACPGTGLDRGLPGHGGRSHGGAGGTWTSSAGVLQLDFEE